ncbi:AAA family ATPase [Rheinheimera sp. NSM]|uniref:AAA family ATPase n=1 Tax=Rheinheimera sp. NSM TaxID=3457884 RepID=UPI0040366F30
MAIDGFTRDEFGRKLNSLVFPSRPIDSIEHLFGRSKELDKIEKALYASGRHIFIYGDRGVGKSSLAATAANQYQSSDAEYIDVSCSPDASVKSIVVNIAYNALKNSRIVNSTAQEKASLNFKFLSVEKVINKGGKNLYEEINNLNDAVEVLKEVSALHSERPIIVLDEFDRMNSLSERNLFADVIKQLGDKRVPIKFIFTGISKTVDELLGAHQSAIRQLETIELPKLSWDARWAIVKDVAKEFGIRVDHELCVRIAAVSDGYPYYVHLITEKLFWCLYEDKKNVTEVTNEHYQAALREAIDSISAELKRPYETAVNQRTGDYEEVLWSTADSEFLHRYLKEMYSSYQYVMKQLPCKEPLSYDKYCSRVRSLKSKSNGEVLIAETKPGLYSYREKMLRGYVRMQAEAHGIQLLGEEVEPTEKQVMHIPSRASTGYQQSKIPKGVHFARKR